MSVTMASCPAGRPSPSVTVLVDSVAQSTLPSWRRRRSSRCCTVPAASAAQSSASMKSLHGRPASCAALQPSSACSLGLLKLVRPVASSIQMPSSAVSTMRRYCSALSRRRRVITRAAEVARSRAVTSCQVSSASSALKATPAMAMPRTASTAPACAKSSRLRTCTVQLRPAKPMYSCASAAHGRRQLRCRPLRVQPRVVADAHAVVDQHVDARQAFAVQAGHQVATRNGEIMPSTVVTAGCVVLRVRLDRRVVSQVIFRDSMTAEVFRELRVRLRFS